MNDGNFPPSKITLDKGENVSDKVPSPKNEFRILVAEDDPEILNMLLDELGLRGYTIDGVADGKAARERLKGLEYSILIADLKLPDIDGLELLKRSRELIPPPQTIMITGYGTSTSAVKAMKSGAYDYILKPFSIDEISRVIDSCVERIRIERENFELKELINLYKITEVIEASLDLNKILESIAQVSFGELDANIVSIVTYKQPGDKVKDSHLYSSSPDINKNNISFDIERMENDYPENGMIILTGEEIKRYLQGPSTLHEGAALSTPLIQRGLKIGRFSIFSLKEGCSFTPLKKEKDKAGGKLKEVGNVGLQPLTGKTSLTGFTTGHGKLLEVLASRAAAAIENNRLLMEIDTTANSIIEGLVTAQEAKDAYTWGHSRRVAKYVEILANQMPLDPLSSARAVKSARLHDIGKIGVPLDLMNKAASITEFEHEIYQLHVRIGVRILEPMTSFHDLIDIIRYHHERYDGSGFLYGIHGERIPVEARLIMVADSFDAMTSERPYRDALSNGAALTELKRMAGAQFDPAVVRAMEEYLLKEGITPAPPDSLEVLRDPVPRSMGPLVREKSSK